jgi:hypothetical protein
MSIEQEPITLKMPTDGAIPLGDDGTVLPDWAAARVLTMMRERHPALLSALIGEAYTGTVPAAQRRTRQE